MIDIFKTTFAGSDLFNRLSEPFNHRMPYEMENSLSNETWNTLVIIHANVESRLELHSTKQNTRNYQNVNIKRESDSAQLADGIENLIHYPDQGSHISSDDTSTLTLERYINALFKSNA